MSQPYADVAITNTSGTPCLIRGYPAIALAGHRGPAVTASPRPVEIKVSHRIYERTDPGPRSLVVRPHRGVFFSIGTATAYDGPLFTLTRLTVTLPGTRSPAAVPVSLPANGPVGRAVPVGVTAVNRHPHS